VYFFLNLFDIDCVFRIVNRFMYQSFCFKLIGLGNKKTNSVKRVSVYEANSDIDQQSLQKILNTYQKNTFSKKISDQTCVVVVRHLKYCKSGAVVHNAVPARATRLFSTTLPEQLTLLQYFRHCQQGLSAAKPGGEAPLQNFAKKLFFRKKVF